MTLLPRHDTGVRSISWQQMPYIRVSINHCFRQFFCARPLGHGAAPSMFYWPKNMTLLPRHMFRVWNIPLRTTALHLSMHKSLLSAVFSLQDHLAIGLPLQCFMDSWFYCADTLKEWTIFWRTTSHDQSIIDCCFQHISCARPFSHGAAPSMFHGLKKHDFVAQKWEGSEKYLLTTNALHQSIYKSLLSAVFLCKTTWPWGCPIKT